MNHKPNSVKHKRLPALFTMVLTLSMVSCNARAAAPTSSSGQAATAIPTTAPTEPPTPATTPTHFVPKGHVKIAVHVPLSADGAATGIDVERAADLAVQQLAGPINQLGFGIEVVPYDDKGMITKALANAAKIVDDPQVLCGVGHLNSDIMVQASEVYHTAGLAFISPANTDPAVTDRGYLEINRIVGRNDQEGAAGAEFAKAQGFNGVFVISNNSDASTRVADDFKREANVLKLTVVGSLTTDRRENFDSVLHRSLSTNPDLIYFAGLLSQAGEFFREARIANYAGAFLGPDVLDTPDLVDLTGPVLTKRGDAYYTNMAAPANAIPGTAQFIQDFQAKYGTAPLEFAAQGYDAAAICMQAIQQASQAGTGKLPTRNEVAVAIRNLKGYKGITGTYSFNNKGDPTLPEYYFYKVASVDPAQWSHNILVGSFTVAPQE